MSAICEAIEFDRTAILLSDAQGIMRFVAWHGLTDHGGRGKLCVLHGRFAICSRSGRVGRGGKGSPGEFRCPATAAAKGGAVTRITAYHLGMHRMNPEYLDPDPSDRAVADILLKEEPDEEEEDEEEHDGDDKEDDDGDEGYSE